jgi:hypothetical protein
MNNPAASSELSTIFIKVVKKCYPCRIYFLVPFAVLFNTGRDHISIRTRSRRDDGESVCSYLATPKHFYLTSGFYWYISLLHIALHDLKYASW